MGTGVQSHNAKLKQVLTGLKRFILWDYARASWQYDVMVALIVIFVMFTPRSWFRDQPRIPHSSQITSLPGSDGNQVFWIEPELVNSVPESDRLTRLSSILKTKTGKVQNVTRIEPILDSEQEIKGYMAFAKP